jgi:hypothetical protein
MKSFVVKFKNMEAIGIRAESAQAALARLAAQGNQGELDLLEEKSPYDLFNELSDAFGQIAGLATLGQEAVQSGSPEKEDAVYTAIEVIQALVRRARGLMSSLVDIREEDLKEEGLTAAREMKEGKR